MNESEWLSSEEPTTMLGLFGPDGLLEYPSLAGGAASTGPKPAASARKLRLFAVACCRQAWHTLTDPRSRQAVGVAERYADGLASDLELASASYAAWSVVSSWEGDGGESLCAARQAAWCAERLAARAAEGAWEFAPDGCLVPPASQAALLRDVFGNPWRPAPSERCTECAGGVVPTDRDDNASPCCHGTGRRFPRRWLTPTALRLARGIYGDRDFGAMPVLADALEEAGCEDGALLWHLRGQYEAAPESWYPPAGPHVRGCWAIDALLGKE